MKNRFEMEKKSHLFDLPYYNFIYKNSTCKSKDGPRSMYVRDNIQYNYREDLAIFVEGKIYFIFIETCINGHNSIAGEIYLI